MFQIKLNISSWDGEELIRILRGITPEKGYRYLHSIILLFFVKNKGYDINNDNISSM